MPALEGRGCQQCACVVGGGLIYFRDSKKVLAAVVHECSAQGSGGKEGGGGGTATSLVALVVSPTHPFSNSWICPWTCTEKNLGFDFQPKGLKEHSLCFSFWPAKYRSYFRLIQDSKPLKSNEMIHICSLLKLSHI